MTGFSISQVFNPLKSRKVRVALTTFIVAVLADYGFAATDEVILGIIGLGASVILGIAHEDAGRKSASAPLKTTSDRKDPTSIIQEPIDDRD